MSEFQGLFSLQGYLRVAPILADGSFGALRWMGNVPEATLQLNTDATDKSESYSGQRLQIGRLTTSTTAAFNYTLDYWSASNLALAFNASAQDIAASTVTSEVFPDDLVAGDLVRLSHPFVSGLTITDSAATPVSVPAANVVLDPTAHSANVAKVIDPGAFTQPFKAAYSYEAARNLVLFSRPGAAVYLQFDGVDTENDRPVLIELWKVRHNPVAELSLINAEYGNLAMTSAVLFDPTRDADASLGGFGRMLQKAV